MTYGRIPIEARLEAGLEVCIFDVSRDRVNIEGKYQGLTYALICHYSLITSSRDLLVHARI